MMLWREACAPLYHCRCSSCEHATAVAQAAQRRNPAASAHPATTAPHTAARARPAKPPDNEHTDGPFVVHIPIKDESGARGAGSVVSLVHDDSRKLIVQFEGARSPAAEEDDGGLLPRARGWQMMDEQDGLGMYERETRDARGDAVRAGRGGGGIARATSWTRSRVEKDWREGTPPKRARPGELELDCTTMPLVRRCSAELDAEGAETDVDTAALKRAPLDAAESPPSSARARTPSPRTSRRSSKRQEHQKLSAADATAAHSLVFFLSLPFAPHVFLTFSPVPPPSTYSFLSLYSARMPPSFL
ncbi:hypothetical protein FB451DRAFT_1242719 [Mycena latifolia]|nr:hypothetical protein FB451DRAFT_1242719 [Mycena latifolia]